MATNNNDTGVNYNFFTSRKNIVGIIAAVIVIILHLTVGLGIFWPVVAVAAWGAGAALTQDPKPKELPAPPTAVPSTEDSLSSRLDETMDHLGSLSPAPAIREQAKELELNCIFVLMEWHEIDTSPEKRQTMWDIIEVYLPEVVRLYENHPQRDLPSTVDSTVDSLRTLTAAVGSIKSAIIENNVRMVDDNARLLRAKFGNLPGLSTSADEQSD